MPIRTGLVLVPLVVLALLLAGCSGCESNDTEERLQRTLREVEEHGAIDEIVEALRKATPESLETPHLIIVRVSYSEEPNHLKTLRFWLEWIEEEPTPDGVLFRNPRTGQEATFHIDELYRRENAMLSKLTVLYHFFYAFEPDSDEAKDFYSQVASGGAEAVLLRTGQAVSNRVSVEAMSSSQWDARSHRRPVTRRAEGDRSGSGPYQWPSRSETRWA